MDQPRSVARTGYSIPNGGCVDVAAPRKPGSGGRTALRGRVRPLAASSVSWLGPKVFSRGQARRIGLTSAGLGVTATSTQGPFGIRPVRGWRCHRRVRRVSMGLLALLTVSALSAAAIRNIPFAEARPVLQALRRDMLPEDLDARSPGALESQWPRWVARRDAAIRERLARGDEDSIVNFLLYGTSFTSRPRAAERELSAIGRDADELHALAPRVDDFVAGLAAPGQNERLQFAREVVERRGMNPATPAGREVIRRYLFDSVRRLAGEVARYELSLRSAAASTDAATAMRQRSTMFRDRGLSSDTSIYVNLGIDQALAAIKSKAHFAPGSVKRVAIVGPGLDFTDKHDGYDFYPQQSLQPFAVIDSLRRLELAAPSLRVTTFDVSRRINRHLAAARDQAQAGKPYVVHLPRNMELPWSPTLVSYWEHFGERIGEQTPARGVPPGAGKVEVRATAVRPDVVLSLDPQDLNVVLQRLEPASSDERFDLIIATDVLVYYDVFEQALALANIARMLRPGGVFLSNTVVFELPAIPLESIAYTDVIYMRPIEGGERGDRIVWYQR